MTEVTNVSCCGLVCTDCLAYKATKTDDDDLREELAKKWSTKELVLSPQDIDCDGCRGGMGNLMKFCQTCEVRNCAIERGVDNCAQCEDYICDKLEQVFGFVGEEAKARLEKIRASP
ncbi:MAG: DUF3795 domain-containing protein [Candidatus Thorarchaeota archaeon]